jgi:hypothetical protein
MVFFGQGLDAFDQGITRNDVDAGVFVGEGVELMRKKGELVGLRSGGLKSRLILGAVSHAYLMRLSASFYFLYHPIAFMP